MATLGTQPVRLTILEELAHAKGSAKTIADTSGVELGVVSYHMRALAEDGLVKSNGTTRRRGAIQTWYVITSKGASFLAKLNLEEDAGA